VSDAEHPEDEPRNEEEASAGQTPAESAEEPVAASEAPEPAAVDEPTPAAADEPAPEPVEAETPAAAEQPVVPNVSAETPAAQPAAEASEADDGEEVAPRQRPEIPGADLIPDLVSDADEFMDAEARAAAEAEAEAAAARAQEDDSDDEARPIADAAINLAAGARYTATGKRKTAVARVILRPGTGDYTINGKTLDVFFPRDTLRRIIRQPLEAVGYETRMDVVARMHGGGVSSQSGALRHGISRALLEADPNLRGELKRRGFLTRDSRVKERKKAGLKKARKRPQFSKR
jgi:small subunit ribosomal protein S9